MRRTCCGTALLMGALLVAGCDNEVGNITTPNEPAPAVTEIFTGTITTNGAITHQFTVASAGTVTATLTEVAPDPTVQVGVGLGTWNGSNCQLILTKDDALQGHAVVGQVSGTGTLCARVSDPAGRLTQPLTYKLSVEHP